MRLSFITLLLATVALCSVSAFAAEPPAVKSFYPAQSDPYQELRPNATLYVYFETGSKVTAAYAVMLQEGQEVGNFAYTNAAGSATPSAKMPDLLPAILELGKLHPGSVTIKITGVDYLTPEGQSESYVCPDDAGMAQVTYRFNGANGKVVALSELKDNTLLSYYTQNSEEGVMTITFDKAVTGRNGQSPSIRLEYGNSERPDNFAQLSVPHTWSDDLKTLQLDFRGVLRSRAAMVPNANFTDDFGSPIDPPSTIILSITNLYCQDGSAIAGNVANITATLHYVLNYRDISLPTPKITAVQYYNSDSPDLRYDDMSAATDMAAISVMNLESLKDFSISFSYNDADFKNDYYSIVSGEIIVTIPDEALSRGTDGLSIYITDPVYSVVDGVSHIIAPYDYNAVTITPRLTSIALVKECEPGRSVILETSEAIVTLANEAGYMFIEDESGALQVVTEDYSTVLRQGTALNGTICGVYAGDGMFEIDMSASQFSESPADVSKGTRFETITEALLDMHLNRLATFVNSDDTPIAYDEDQDWIIIGNTIVTANDFLPSGFTMPQEITAVTGILYTMQGVGGMPGSVTMLILRGADDIDSQVGIAELQTQESSHSGVYNSCGVMVRKNGENIESLPSGLYISNGKKFIIP